MRAQAEQLLKGETITFKVKGNSMYPIIFSGETVTVEPIVDKCSLEPYDVVLCKVSGRYYLHTITNIRLDAEGLTFEISNCKRHVIGWTQAVYGLVINVE